MADQDYAAEVLAPLQFDNTVKDRAWNAYYSAKDPTSFKSNMDAIPELDINTKNALWSKWREQVNKTRSAASGEVNSITQPGGTPPKGPAGSSSEKDGFLTQLGKSAGIGLVGQLYGGTGGVLTMLGDRFGSDTLRGSGQELTQVASDFVTRMREGMPEAPRTKDVGMQAMGNPDWWAQAVGEGLGSLIASAAAGGLTQAAVKQLVARGAVKGALASTLANHGAPLAGGAYEGLMQMGSTYNEAKARGLDDGAAMDAAIADGVTTGSLGVLGEKWGIFNKVDNTLGKRMVRSALAEGVTEGALQQPASNIIAQQSYDPERQTFADSPEAFVGGAAGGPVGGVVGHLASNLRTAPPPIQPGNTTTQGPPPPPPPGAPPAPTASAAPIAPSTPPPSPPSASPAAPVVNPAASPQVGAPVASPAPAAPPVPAVAPPPVEASAPQDPVLTPPAVPASTPTQNPLDLGVSFTQQPAATSQQGTPVEGAPAQTQPQPEAAPQRKSERGKLGDKDAVFGDEDEGMTPNQTPVGFRYAVVDIRDLITSFDGEKYDQDELQPRDTQRITSRQRIEDRKGNLLPQAMASSFMTTDGAPLAKPDSQLLTGNHRVKALQELYQEGRPRAQSYRDWMVKNANKFGLDSQDVDQIERPILIRVTNPKSAGQIARESNYSTTSVMSDAEQAVEMAKHLTGSAWNEYNPTDDGLPNVEFAVSVMQKLPPEMQSGFMDGKGRLSIAGARKLREAVFAKAYGDTTVLNTALESLDNNIRNITNGMMLAAPEMAKLADDVASGNAYDYNIGEDLAIAASVIANSRKTGQSISDWLKQESTTRQPIDNALVEMLDKYKRSGRKIADVLNQYANGVRQLGNPNFLSLFPSDEPLPSKEELMYAAQQSVGEVTAADESAANPTVQSEPARQPNVEAGAAEQSIQQPEQQPEVEQAAQPMDQSAPAPRGEVPGGLADSQPIQQEEQLAAPPQEPEIIAPQPPRTAPPPIQPPSAPQSGAKPRRKSLSQPLIPTTPPPPVSPKPKPKSEKKAKPQDRVAQTRKLGDALSSKANEARERLKKLGDGTKLFSGIDPQIIEDLAIIGADYVWRGAISLKNFTAKMVAEFGEGIRPHLQAIYDRSVELVEETQKSIFGEDNASGNVAQENDSDGTGYTSEPPKASPGPSQSAAPPVDGQSGTVDNGGRGSGAGDATQQDGTPERPASEQRQELGPTRKVVTIMEDKVPKVDESIVPEKFTNNPDPNSRMQPHQTLATALALKALNNPMVGGFLLADGPGAGKTLVALAVADEAARQGRKVLVVSMAEVFKFPGGKKSKTDRPKGTYDEWAKKWDIPIYRYMGQGDPLTKGEIKLATYHNFNHALKNVDADTTVIFDEGHALKNVGRDSARSVIGLKMMERAGQVLYMSATPADRIEDIQYLASMGVFGSRNTESVLKDIGLIRKSAKIKKFNEETGEFIKKGKDFEREPGYIYSSPPGKRKQVVQNMMDAFTNAVVSGTMIKREIPLDNYDIDFSNVEMSPENNSLLSLIEETYNQYGWSAGQKKNARDMAIRRVLEEMYVPQAVEDAMKELEQGRKVIFFTTRVNDSEIGPNVKTYSSTGELIDERRVVVHKSPGTPFYLRQMLRDKGIFGRDVVELTSAAEDDDGNKYTADEVMKAFNEGDAQVLIATIESGGTGLNLDDRVGDKPRTIIMLTPPFSATGIIQALGRTDRLSTKSRAKAVVFHSQNRVSGWNIGIIGSKLQTLGAIVRGVPQNLLASVPQNEFLDVDSFDVDSEEGNDNPTAKPLKSGKRGRRNPLDWTIPVRWDAEAGASAEGDVARWRRELPAPQQYFEQDPRTIGRYGYLGWSLGQAKMTELGDWTREQNVAANKIEDIMDEIRRLGQQIPGEDIIEFTETRNNGKIVFRAPYGVMSIDFWRLPYPDNRGRLVINCYRSSMFPDGPVERTRTSPPPGR